jgi:hypothetical protein
MTLGGGGGGGVSRVLDGLLVTLWNAMFGKEGGIFAVFWTFWVFG